MAERALAHVEFISDISPIEGADRIELASVLGWKVVISKDDGFKVGDKIVYIEIDSKLPQNETFRFMEKYKYRVKTIKLRGQYSQGLIIPLKYIGRNDATIGEDVTKELGITYYDPEDAARKAPSIDRYASMKMRHRRFFKTSFAKWMMEREWGKKFLFFFLGRKRDKKTEWPSWVKKTDEERIQNIPWMLNDKSPWVATEKIDGSSTTFTMRKDFFGRYHFYVCSRNVVFNKPTKKCFYDTNIYLEMAEKYHMYDVLKQILEENKDWHWVTIQGETYGDTVQRRNYCKMMGERDFLAFNFITEEGRWASQPAKNYIARFGIPWVPILNANYVLPDTVDELLKHATGQSKLDGLPREGIVFRSKDGARSFKAVSNEYLMLYHG